MPLEPRDLEIFEAFIAAARRYISATDPADAFDRAELQAAMIELYERCIPLKDVYVDTEECNEPKANALEKQVQEDYIGARQLGLHDLDELPDAAVSAISDHDSLTNRFGWLLHDLGAIRHMLRRIVRVYDSGFIVDAAWDATYWFSERLLCGHYSRKIMPALASLHEFDEVHRGKVERYTDWLVDAGSQFDEAVHGDAARSFIAAANTFLAVTAREGEYDLAALRMALGDLRARAALLFRDVYFFAPAEESRSVHPISELPDIDRFGQRWLELWSAGPEDESDRWFSLPYNISVLRERFALVTEIYSAGNAPHAVWEAQLDFGGYSGGHCTEKIDEAITLLDELRQQGADGIE